MNALLCRFRGEKEREPLHVPDCGLDYVYQLNGYTLHETRHGPGFSFRDVFGMHRVLGHHLANLRRPLTGQELRFLRVGMELSQQELGGLLGLSDQQVARWEKGANQISGAANILFRCLYLESLGCKVNLRTFAGRLQEPDDGPTGPVVLRTKEKWELSFAN